MPAVPTVPAAEEGSRESVDAKCMKLTAPWVRERAQQEQDIETCGFYNGLDAAGPEGRLDAGKMWQKQNAMLPIHPSAHAALACLKMGSAT